MIIRHKFFFLYDNFLHQSHFFQFKPYVVDMPNFRLTLKWTFGNNHLTNFEEVLILFCCCRSELGTSFYSLLTRKYGSTRNFETSLRYYEVHKNTFWFVLVLDLSRSSARLGSVLARAFWKKKLDSARLAVPSKKLGSARLALSFKNWVTLKNKKWADF